MIYKEDRKPGNYSKGRTLKPKGLLLHHTGDYSKQSIINTFTNPESKASAHVVIWKDGSRTIFVDETLIAWHAGISSFKGELFCNNYMIGIEFHGDTNKEPLTEEQIQSFLEYAIPRITRYRIKKDYITDHRTVSPDRKTDLNPKELERVLKSINYLFV